MIGASLKGTHVDFRRRNTGWWCHHQTAKLTL